MGDSSRNEPIQAPVDRTCLHELFEAQVDRTPESTALVLGERAWTYRELDEQANRIARGLLAAGVRPGHVVALHTRRSFSTIAGLLGVLKAGAGYLPVDPALPAARIAYMLEDSGATVLLADRATSPAGGRLDTLVLDDPEAWAAHPGSRPAVAVEPGDLAYLIYTSGSTGQPKAVMVPHRAIVNHTRWAVADLWQGKPLRFLHRMSLSFDASNLELCAPLTSGGTVVLTPSQTGIDMDELRELVTGGRIDVLGVTPAVLREILAVRALEGTGLPWLMCGGEALDPELVAECAAQVPGVEVINFYGPTETCVNSTWFPAAGSHPGPGPVPIGSPIRGTTVHVVDEALNPVPDGEAGELLIGGAGVTLGYLGRPGLTAQRFVPDPFGPPGARLYRTGDLVRRGAAGALEFLGRIDHQVKLRGFRIELGEVEAALAGLAGVTDAVVTAVAHPGDGTRLVGYVTGGADPRALREQLGTRLPDYMVPSVIVGLDRLPLTSNGKVDRAALPAPDLAGSGDGHVGPRDAVEQLLTELAADVLGVDAARVGVHDDFFELGGHSLLVSRLIARARGVLAGALTPRDVFEDRTVAALAARMRQARPAAPPEPIRPAEGEERALLSPAQERLWFLEQLRPGTTTYTTAVEYRLRGALDAPALRAALNDVVERHDALRTVFPAGGERPRQLVLERIDLPWEFHDLRQSDAAAVRSLVDDFVREPFDLTTGPLIRARLVAVGDQEHLLLLTVHHIAFDGWSFNVLTRELSHCYRARARRTAPDLPAMTLQYADFAAWQRNWLSGGPAAEQLAYWQGRLADAPAALNLPLDRPRPAVQSHRGAFEPVLIPTDLVERLRDLGRREGTTLFMTLLAGFKLLLARHSGVADIVVGTPVANRDRVELENLIGFLVNTLALRTDLAGDPTVSELLGRVRETCLGAYAHQDVPFEQVVEALQPSRDLSRSPVVQVMFGFDVAGERVGSLHEVGLDFTRLENGFAVCDVILDLVDDPRGVIGGFTYATDLFDAETVRRMAGHYLTILDSMTRHDPAALRTSRVRLLGAAERAELVAAGTAPETTWPEHVGLHEQFEAQVDRTPDAVAVRYAEQAWTYRQLDERANRIAWRLRARGIGPEHVVALCAQRSPHLAAGVLGILKAGAAYLPIDPALPQARIHYMLEDAASTTVLTDRETLGQVEGRGQVLLLDDEDTWSAEPSHRPAVTVRHDDLAYLIYTSGSTGLPKAVTMSHRGIHWLAVSLAEEIIGDGPAPKSVALNSPIFFDGHVIQFSWMADGATMVIVPENVRRDPRLLVDLLVRHEIDLMDCTPSQLEMATGLGVLYEIPTGTRMLVIGEAVSEKLWRTLGEGPWQSYNLYGPTETHAATMTVVEPGEPLSIGVPMRGYDAFVIDDTGELVPRGVAGELVIGGGRMARGYHNRAALTAQRFVPDSFTGRAGRRLYRTGDIVRATPAGALEFIGRRDNQVKVRGYRIELGEIEAAILREPGVTASAVMLRDGAAGDKRIVAYFTAPPTVTEAQVLRSLESRLPEYMVPSALLRLDSFPMTRNGKVDRAAMPEATPVDAGAADATPPGDATEDLLTGLWSELLGDRGLGVHSHFFKSGGYSLLAIQLIARINKAFEVDLPLQVLFQNPTPHDMARELRKSAR